MARYQPADKGGRFGLVAVLGGWMGWWTWLVRRRFGGGWFVWFVWGTCLVCSWGCLLGLYLIVGLGFSSKFFWVVQWCYCSGCDDLIVACQWCLVVSLYRFCHGYK